MALQGFSGGLQGYLNSLQGYRINADTVGSRRPDDLFIYDDNVYVAEFDRVSVYSTSGSLLERWYGLDTPNNKIYAANSIVVYNDEVYITQGISGITETLVFDLSGNYVREFGNEAAAACAILGGEVFRSKSSSASYVYSTTGTYLRAIPLGSHSHITTDGTFLYFAQFSGINKSDTNGSVITTYSSAAYSLDVDSSYIVTTFRNSNLVRLYTMPAFTLSVSFGSFGTGNGQFDRPTAVRMYNSELYVADSFNQRIQVFDFSGNYVS